MKTLKINFPSFAILFVFITLAFLGCSKEKDSNKQKLKDGTLKATTMRTLYIEFNLNNEITFIKCDIPPQNCLPTVIIKPDDSPQAHAYTLFIQSLTNHAEKLFFSSNNWMRLFPELQLSQEVLLGLQTGDIVLYHEKGTNDNFNYYIGLPKDISFNSNWKGYEKCVLVIDCSQQ